MKILNIIVILTAICFLSACSNDKEDEPGGASDIEKQLPGYWNCTFEGWAYDEMWIFKDGCIVNGSYRAGNWAYEKGSNAIVINGSSPKIINIHSFADNSMVCTAKDIHSGDALGYTKGSNSEFARVYQILANRYFDLDLPFNKWIEFDDNFHGVVTESGKEIIIKNPFYLKKSSIIYDGTEYKFNGDWIL